jgi:hypothetical protein
LEWKQNHVDIYTGKQGSTVIMLAGSLGSGFKGKFVYRASNFHNPKREPE